MSIYQNEDLPGYFPLLAAGLGTAYIWGGRVADAVPLLTQAIEQTMATEMVRYQGWCQRSLGEAWMVAGRLEEAHALAGASAGARPCARRTWPPSGRLVPPRRHCDAARAPGVRAAEDSLIDRPSLVAEELGMRPLQAHCHRGLGALYATIGQRERAHTRVVRAAIAMYKSMAMMFWLPHTEAALAQVEKAITCGERVGKACRVTLHPIMLPHQAPLPIQPNRIDVQVCFWESRRPV